MDRELDDLAISFATGRSRRDALKKLALGAFGAPIAALGGLGLTEAEAKKGKKNKKDKKNDKKKVTLCHNGQTITVSKKAKKAHLRHGDTVGPCQDTPPCTPNPNACGNRKCGSVDNGCGVQVPCGNCTNAITNCEERTCIDGQCGVRNLPQGTACDDGNACTTGETCQGGVCGGGMTVTCTNPPSECQVSTGTCEPATGLCTYADKADNTACDDGNACTTGDTCQSGVCTAGAPLVCPPPVDECHDGGVCDASTGTCTYAQKPDNTPCRGGSGAMQNKCLHTCQEGVCGDIPVECPGANECNTACDGNTGTCLDTPQPRNQGGQCANGTGMCVDGACEVTNATMTCAGVNPCLAPTFCNPSQTCICYSTVEGAGFCIESSQAKCFNAEVRPACEHSDACGDAAVCVPLKENSGSTESCCGTGAQFPGFCVPLAARCASAV